ncbi:MAG: hypothetical protein M1825_005131 [Sarcosagium campestre]|nr:MAG: hypothetical protein M1825_005131 [Sarcosagium campestre]
MLAEVPRRFDLGTVMFPKCTGIDSPDTPMPSAPFEMITDTLALAETICSLNPKVQHTTVMEIDGPDVQSECGSIFGTSPKGLVDLPLEIHEGILDHLFGIRASTLSSASESSPTRHGWSSILRHPRRKQLSNLALVCKTWTGLVQERLYRHIKVKGTTKELNNCQDWFLSYPHLQPYVRHIEVWIPVWERKLGIQTNYAAELHVGQMPDEIPRIPPNFFLTATGNDSRPVNHNLNAAYQLASHNASIEEIFECVKHLFPDACVLTLEGGHCKRPPMVHHFRLWDCNQPCSSTLPVLESIRAVVFKGAWNILREESHFQTLMASLPNVREWHCTYAKPKSPAYLTMASILPRLPATLSHLNISLEGFHCHKSSSPKFWSKVYPKTHICSELAKAVPQLEALTYTGRICAEFFHGACRIMHAQGTYGRLKSIDLIVKNTCKSKNGADDSSGVSNIDFIKSFVAIVTAGVRSLSVFPEVNYLRIRFIDLDSPAPLLNPYFHLQGDRCTGIWTEELLHLLAVLRPGTRYLDLSDNYQAAEVDKYGRVIGALAPRRRPLAIKASSYAAIASSV